MGIIQDSISGGTGSLIKAVGDEVAKFTDTKEEKVQYDVEMAKAQWQYQSDMQKMSLAEKQALYLDLDSARTHDTAIQTTPYTSMLVKNTSSYLALGTVIITFTLFLLVIFYNKLFGKEALDPATKDIVIYILGVLSAIMTQIYSFYFGSSKGSSDKSITIDNMLNKKS